MVPVRSNKVEIESLQEWKVALSEVGEYKICGLDLRTTGPDPLTSRIRLVNIAFSDGRVYVADVFDLGESVIADLAELVEDEQVEKVMHDAKQDLSFIRVAALRRLKFKNIFDIMLASKICWSGYYYLSPSNSPKNPWKKKKPEHSLEALAERHLGVVMKRSDKADDWSGESLPDDQVIYASNCVQLLLPLHEVFRELLAKNELEKVAGLEFSALSPIAEMEISGMYLDAGSARALISEKEAQIIKAFGEMQSEARRRGFTPARHEGKSTRGFLDPNLREDIKAYFQHEGFCITSTKAAVLQELATRGSVFAGSLLQYRRLSHQLAYLYDWLEHIHPADGRIHSQYFQLQGSTGRLSSRRPNAQQVPKKGEDGLALRRLFQAPPGKKLVSADFSTIEMRIMAHLSGDQTMIEAFREGQDLHRLTASRISGLPLEQISKEQRNAAKVVNFLLIYGGSAETLQWRAQSDYGVIMPLEEAYQARERFFETYSGVKEWQERQIREMSFTHEHHFHNCVQGFFSLPLTCTFTALGRRRVWPRFGSGMTASKFQLFNTPCQGTGADLIKLVMCELYDRLTSEDAKIVASVHDEILLEVPEDEAEDYAEMLCEIMNRVGSQLLHPVPVTSEAKILSSWGD